MSKNAAQTTVPVSRSQTELEDLLAGYGATQFVRGWDVTKAVVGFVLGGRQIRVSLTLPDPRDEQLIRTPTGRTRTPTQASQRYEQECRRRRRALEAVVKAKLEAVDEEISTLEREFLADVVLVEGQTFGEWAGSQIESMYRTTQMPALLPGFRALPERT